MVDCSGDLRSIMIATTTGQVLLIAIGEGGGDLVGSTGKMFAFSINVCIFVVQAPCGCADIVD